MIVAFRKRKHSLFSWLISWWTKSIFVHCEIVLAGGTMISAVEKRGVRIIYTLDEFSEKSWELVEITMTEKQETDIYTWCLGELGCKYDWAGILFCQVFKFGRQHKDKWFCSEFCTAALQQAGWLQGVKPYQQCPGKLYQLLTGVRK